MKELHVGTLHTINSMDATGLIVLVMAAGRAKRVIISLLAVIAKRGAILRLGSFLTIEIPSKDDSRKRRKR
jgi:hypothetical protein